MGQPKSDQRLPSAAEALTRAQYFLDDLEAHQHHTRDFRFRLPYVLDLLVGVSRAINDESKGMRTSAFAAWWGSAKHALKPAMDELRNAELKEYKQRTGADIHVVITDGAGTDTNESVTTVEWRFVGGSLDGQPVLQVLRGYLIDVGQLLADAEDYLAGRKP